MFTLPTEKRCVHCGDVKPASDFNVVRGPRLHSYCNPCRLQIDRDRYERNRLDPAWCERERERCRLKQQRWREANPDLQQAETTKRAASLRAKWRDSPEHREHVKVRKRRKYSADPVYREAVQSRNKRWNATPRGRHSRQIIEHRRRIKEKEAKDTLTYDEWQLILRLQGAKCARCKTPFGLFHTPHRDHIVPITRGGALTLDNTQALCHSCNSKKRDKSTDYRTPAHKHVISEMYQE